MKNYKFYIGLFFAIICLLSIYKSISSNQTNYGWIIGSMLMAIRFFDASKR